MGCHGGGDAPDGVPVASALAQHNVMIIDEGIDLTSPDLQGKVAAAFTALCDTSATDGGASDTTSDGGAAEGTDAGTDGGPSFEDQKRAYIARLGVADQSCHLLPFISAKSDPLASIEAFRSRWNGMVRNERFRDQVFSMAEWNKITSTMDPILAPFSYHGTSTASTAAHENPSARLVLIERHLQDPTTEVADYTCTTQDELDQSVALLSDPDVRDAYLHAPESLYTTQFEEVVRQFDVGLVNLSFGSLSRQGLELMQQMKGCPPVDFRPYFTVLHELRVAGVALETPKPYLVVQSAGNESQTLDSGADSVDCTPEDPFLLTVGSTTLVGTPSKFSNVGACVNVVAPGERVIAPYAGDWLLIDQGTSFSAPLITRLLSLTATEPFDPKRARAELLARLAPTGGLTFSAVPRDFFYAPQGPAATVDALVLAPATAETARARVLRALAHADLAPVLAPLRALRASKLTRL
jgi:hypothetical protein